MKLSIAKYVSIICLTSVLSSVMSVAFDTSAAAGPQKECLPRNGSSTSVTPSICEFNTEDGTGSNGCKVGMKKVVASSCTVQVTTFLDDACDGGDGTCVPPTLNATALKTITAKATPKIDTCIHPPKPDVPSPCKCEVTTNENYSYGRKTCGGK